MDDTVYILADFIVGLCSCIVTGFLLCYSAEKYSYLWKKRNHVVLGCKASLRVVVL